MTDLARSIAGAYGDQNIRAYSVNPAFFETALVSEGGKQFMPDSARTVRHEPHCYPCCLWLTSVRGWQCRRTQGSQIFGASTIP